MTNVTGLPPAAVTAAQGNGTKFQFSTGTTTTNDCVKYDANGNTVDAGAGCGSGTGANPSATAGPTAVNGSAGTFMRSDGAPAVQKASNSQFGIMEGDGLTVGCTGTAGVCNTLSQIIAGTTQTITAAQWAPCSEFDVKTAAQTLTLPLSSTLSANGCAFIKTIGQSVTLTPNGSDSINGGSAGVGVTIASGLLASVTVDPATANNLLVGPTSAGAGTVTTSGSPASGNLAKFSGSTAITNGDLSGDATTSGTLATTVAKVNGVAYAASPSVHQTPVITASNTATYKTLPDCTDTGGNHLNYTQSTDAYSCGTSGGGGGGGGGPAKIVNNWYWAVQGQVSGGASNQGTSTIEWTPICIGNAFTIGALGLNVINADSGKNVQLGIYAADGTTGLPTGAKLVSTSNISVTSTGPVSGTVSQAFSANTKYWIGVMTDSSTVIETALDGSSSANGNCQGASSQADLSGAGGEALTRFYTSGTTFGTWPTNPTVGELGAVSIYSPLPQYKVASVP